MRKDGDLVAVITFKRVEKKYMMTHSQYYKFRKLIEDYMQVDKYGFSTICNLYYDTENYELARRSIEKPVYKEKFRLRSYGVPEITDTVFLELKKKYKGVVYKRRVELPLKEAYESIKNKSFDNSETGSQTGQIEAEITYFLNQYDLYPRVFLAYDRIAMFGKKDLGLRMTFDFNIRNRTYDIDLLKGDKGELLFDDDRVLLEIKVSAAYPFWLVHALEECGIYPVSFSKYGTIYKKYLFPDYNTKVKGDVVLL